MVFREETVLQVQTLLADIDKRSDSQRIEKEILAAIPASAIPGPVRNNDNQTAKARENLTKTCLANNLFHSVYKCRLKKIRFILENGFNINSRNDYGYGVLVAALHIENDASRNKMFKYLLNNSADPLECDLKYGRNALGWASLMGRSEEVKLVLDTILGDFDFHDKDKEGMTALHLATQSGHGEVVRLLVTEMRRFGKSVDVTDNLGLTPYLHAKRLGYADISQILRVEGNACVGQGDLYSFKRADEWKEIGMKERQDMAKQRRYSEYEQAAIAGSSRRLQNFAKVNGEIVYSPRFEVYAPTAKQTREIIKNLKDNRDQRPPGTKTVRVISPKSSASAPISKPKTVLQHKEQAETERISPTSREQRALSLIQLTSSEKGQVPTHFRQSQVDIAKVPEFRHLESLSTLMAYLAEEKSSSYRPHVPPPKPMEVLTAKQKVKRSTLAIIFGKRGKKAPKKLKKSDSKRSSMSLKSNCSEKGKEKGKK